MTAPISPRSSVELLSNFKSPPTTIYTLLASGKDVMPLVLRCLPTIQDVSRFRLCCRTFKRIVAVLPAEFFRPYIERYQQAPRKLWYVDAYTRSYERGDRQGIRIFRKYAPQLNNLKIHVQPTSGEGLCETIEDFRILASQAEHITELDWEFIRSSKFIDYYQQIAFLPAFKNLAKVNLCVSGGSNLPELIHNRFFMTLAGVESLHTITINYNGILDPERFCLERTPWPNLKHLKIVVGKKNAKGNFLRPERQFLSFGEDTFFNNICNRLQSFQHLDSFTLLACPFNLTTCPFKLKERDVRQGELLKSIIDRIPTKSCELQFDFEINTFRENYVKYPFKLRVPKNPEFSVACWMGNYLYDGPFKDYLPHGKGKLLSNSGNVVFEGKFNEGIPSPMEWILQVLGKIRE